MHVDFIIIGQGIAGTCLAFELIKHKKTFIIIDEFQPTSASQVALGIYNPIILKWFTKPWLVDDQINYFNIFYNEINNFLNINCFDDIGIYKLLKNVYDQNTWLSKNTTNGRNHYMSPKLHAIKNKSLVNNEIYGYIKKAGRVNIKLLLQSFRQYLIKNNLIIEDRFQYHDLIVKKSSLIFRDITAKNIVFCQGYSKLENPYFKNLNYKPTKGEILHIYCKDLNLDKIIHTGLILTPLGDDYYAIGATYDWGNINTNPTIEAKQKIINVLDNTINIPYKIIDHLSAVRPSTEDRRPLVGTSKIHPNIHILNGLGSRGVLLAPYFSRCLIRNVFFDEQIPKEVSIVRLFQ